ncbi:MAG: DMT family transporter [Pseudomonadota bacterium]
MNGAPLRGILLMIFGLSMAAFSGGLMKILAETMPPTLIVWFRFSLYFLIMVPVVAVRTGRAVFNIPRPGMQVLRGVVMGGSTICFITGARTLPYADAIAILYAYPFFLTLVAPWLLGEKVSLAAWLGVVGGFAGVLIIMRPSFDGVGMNAVWVLACAVLVTTQLVLNRKLGAVADPLVTSCYGACVATVVTSLALPWLWQPVPVSDWGLLGLLGITGAIAQTAIVMAFSRANASDLAPFTYSEIISAVVFGLLMFGTLPDWLSWIGIGLIVASGVLVARAMAMRNMPRRVPKI